MNQKVLTYWGQGAEKETFLKIKEIYNHAEYEEASKILKIQNHDIENIGKGKIVIATGELLIYQ